MAEHFDSSPGETDLEKTEHPTSRRGMRDVARSAKRRMARTSTTLARAAKPVGASFRKPLRSVVILSMVGGLVATVALPAYAAFNAPSDDVTIEQVAADNAQSLVVASDVTVNALSRGSYAATTAEEVERKKAAEAAAARLAAAGTSASVSSSAGSSVNLSMVAPGSGAVRWPLDMSSIRVGRGFGADGYHQGIDLLGPQGTPEFAAAAGTVRVAGWYYGYGNAVVIDHVINGQSVSTLYGHMVDGGVLVSPGQYVEAGQMIGLMGSTGSSTANHLHFEVKLNGGNVDPYAWLQANAG